MTQLYKSFEQINKDETLMVDFFKDKIDLFAHTHKNKKFETLHQHINEVRKYFLNLIKVNDIEPIIDKIIDSISIQNDRIKAYIKDLFFLSIVFHDFGKINPNFQSERMQNNLFSKNDSIKIGYEHSFLSAYFFINYCIDKSVKLDLTKEERIVFYVFSFLFSIPIIKHHSGYLEKDYDFSKEKIDSIHFLTEILNLKISKEQLRKFFVYESSADEQNLWFVFEKIIKDKNFNYFPLFALLKLNYSLLTASDYLATSDYMNDIKLETEIDFGLITNEMKKRLICNFDNNEKTPYNGVLIRDLDKYLSKNIDELSEKKNENLNFIRQKLGAEVLVNIENHKSEKVFYIEAPTGGGKTNMSMIAVRKMLELHLEINKVFYVFPFTTLITQTAKAIKDTFGLDDNEIAQLHSKSGFQEKEYGREQDAHYGKERRNQIDNLFVNYPFILMTHIKFFDILKSNKKDANYLLHRLANSVVIIDELQSYNPEHWDKIKYFVAQYSELFNIRFVIMSATLPKIDEIELSDYKPKCFVSLIPEAKKYLQNPNFSGRVEIKTDLLSKTIELIVLADLVFEKSEKYAQNRTDNFNGSVYTIIEFIFKKSASAFYDLVTTREKFFDEIFVLSGTIIEPRRKYIIEYLKDEENRKKKILLITTQVVEAGVDIDMDLGFKNRSLLDSDEQLAGRINRNVNKQNCELWLFEHDTPKSIYGKDLRYEATRKFDIDFIKEILTKKEFEKLYKKVFEQIEKDNNSAYNKGLKEYLDNFKRIDFKGIQMDFKLIDSENASIFVPIDIDVLCYTAVDKNTDKKRIENNFTNNEIRFIEQNNCFSNENKVSGEKIWSLYISFIQDNTKKFSADIKILNGIMSKFVFSIFIKKANDLQKYCKFNEETGNYKNYQYYKFEKEFTGEGKIYDLLSGINEKLLEEELKQKFEFI
ncbi:MAG TPA: CRISPR-associated protein [Bacteroidales bacterium]|nr:CRISPR-associated protein [Bacteroidales bacterium]